MMRGSSKLMEILKLLRVSLKQLLLLKICNYIGSAKENQQTNAREWSCLAAAPRRLVCALEMKPPLLPLWNQLQSQPRRLRPAQHKQCKSALWLHVDALKTGKAGVTIATLGFAQSGATP